MTTPMFGVTGWKNSGKTTLVTRLITALSEKGLRVSSIKHAHHRFDIDTPGTDSYRHREAGATEVALVSSKRVALMREIFDETEPSLADIAKLMAPCDIIIIEGYKRERHPKIEVRRKDARQIPALSATDPTIIAIAADYQIDDETCPIFQLDDIESLVEVVLQNTNDTVRAKVQ